MSSLFVLSYVPSSDATRPELTSPDSPDVGRDAALELAPSRPDDREVFHVQGS